MHREARVWQQRDADSRLHFGLQASEKAAPAAWGHVSGSCDSVGRDGLTNAGAQPWSVAKKQIQNLDTRISSPVTKEAGRKSLEIQRLVKERKAEASWRH